MREKRGEEGGGGASHETHNAFAPAATLLSATTFGCPGAITMSPVAERPAYAIVVEEPVFVTLNCR